jgi:hypothetical protein
MIYWKFVGLTLMELNLFEVFTLICTMTLSFVIACHVSHLFSAETCDLDSSGYVYSSYTFFMFVTLVVGSLLRCYTALPVLLAEKQLVF